MSHESVQSYSRIQIVCGSQYRVPRRGATASRLAEKHEVKQRLAAIIIDGWGGRDRTCEWRHQKPLPYRLATPQQASKLAVAGGLYRGNLIAQQLNRRAAPSHGCLPQFRAEYLQVLPEFAESSAPHRLRRW